MFDRIEKGLCWDRLWRLVDGCTPCSPGCRGCWSAAYTHRFTDEYTCYTHANESTPKKPCGWPKFNSKIELRYNHLDLPPRTKKPQAWLILNDLFHEQINDNFVRSAWENMVMSPRHIFLVLTKRIKGMAEFFKHRIIPENVWPMITVCNQEEADRDIPFLLQINAAVRGVSIEPMLGPININLALARGIGSIQWVVLGGESGPGARPMHPECVRLIRDQCQAAGVPFFFKQWGEWAWSEAPEMKIYPCFEKFQLHRFDDGTCMYRIGKKLAGRLLEGREWNELSEVIK